MEKIDRNKWRMDVIIPHLNYVGLRRGLVTLRKHTPKEHLGKIILIDQNPEYQQVDDLVDIHIRVKNQGFAKANNMGIRLSDAPYVACMNDDIEFIHPKWIEGVISTFEKYYSTCLCLNPASSRNPESSGGKPVDHPDFSYKTEWTEEEYDKMMESFGKFVIDGICMFFPIFRREMLDKLLGIIPGKAWFDEAFLTGGGEDYEMNYRAYLSGMRCLGGGSVVYHWWYSTKRPGSDNAGVKYDNYFVEKCGLFDENHKLIEGPDVYGKKGIKKIIPIKLRND